MISAHEHCLPKSLKYYPFSNKNNRFDNRNNCCNKRKVIALEKHIFLCRCCMSKTCYKKKNYI